MRHALLPPWLAALAVPLAVPFAVLPGLANAAPPETDPTAVATAAALTTTSAGARALTLQEALRRLEGRHPLLASRLSELQAADAGVQQAGTRPNPVLEAEVEDFRRETRTTTILLTQPIELGGKRAARLDAAERTRELAQSHYHSAAAQLRAELTSAFFEALTAQERIRLAQTALEVARRASDAASRRVAAGKIAPIDETKAKVAEATVRVELVQAQGEFRAKLQALGAALGEPVGFDRVDGDANLPSIPSALALEARLLKSPALRQAELETLRMGALARVERSKRIPDLSVGIGAKRSQELGRQQAIVTLSIPLPVWDSNRGGELEALRREDKARFDAQALALRLRAEVAQAFERLQASSAEAQALQNEVLPGAQAAFDAATKGFELGKFAFLDVLDAQRTLLQTRAQHLKATAEAYRAASEIDRLIGDGSDAEPATSVEPR